MNTKSFYKIIDTQLTKIINQYKDLPIIKSNNDLNGKKSAAFLLWYMQNYASNISNPEDFIVDGTDDSSCDIIYKSIDEIGDEIFYVVQAKWFAESNILKTNGTGNIIKACLSDFKLILSGKKTPSTVNHKFNTQYTELLAHKNKNRRIEFIFLSLCKNTDTADANIKAFRSSLVGFKKLHIELLKRNYIYDKYMNLKKNNALNDDHGPQGDITIDIEKENFIEIKKGYSSYIFLIKPALIYDLYEKYGDSLFYKNIRNPLSGSEFNEYMCTTLEKEPENFWFYNNGITAITDKVYDFHDDSSTICINKFQIINGAQTCSAIHDKYKELTNAQQRKVNEEVLITLRLLKSGGNQHDLRVTRFTNSQNPVNHRDFHANDEIQTKLQNDFFEYTNIWYERRRGEFKKGAKPKGVKRITNMDLAQSYLSCIMQEPLLAKNSKKFIFVSTSIDKKNGLYERIFTDNISYREMIASYYLHQYVSKKQKEFSSKYKETENKPFTTLTPAQIDILNQSFILHSSHLVSAFLWSKLIVEYGNSSEAMGKIITGVERNKTNFIELKYNKIISKIKAFIINKKESDSSYTDSKYFKSRECFTELKAVL